MAVFPPGETHEGRGWALGITAFVAWGLSPLFWKLLADVWAPTLLAHRIVWALPVFVVVAIGAGQGRAIQATLRDPRQARWMLISALFVAANWVTYLFAVVTDRVMHASLGYFLNPLLSTLMGALILGEPLRRRQWAGMIAASLGVAWLGTSLGVVPWIGLVLAGSFGVYGLVRKQAPVPALAGSAVEVLMLAPFAAVGVALSVAHEGMPDLWTGGLLVLTGGVTAVPLALFAAAVKVLRLSTVGILQFIAPSMQFLLAVVVFGEPFVTEIHGVAFGLIWLGVALFLSAEQRAR